MDSHTLAPIQFVPLKETVYRKLLNAILSGKLPPGELFTISELARQLEVSPMPVREVIKGLEAENLITVQRNGRIMIRELSVNELNELVEIRLNLELMALRKATKNCTDESIKELERLSHKVNAAQNVGEFLKRNTEFHYAIYRGANGGGNDHKVLSARNHGGIIEGMLERNTQKACKWLRRDLKNSAKIIISVLRN
jgi:DNA-binding GntR family transcriptional regulator